MSHIDKGKSLSILTDKFVPSHVRENHAEFVLFLQKFFEYLEQDLGVYDIVAHLRDYADIDDTVDAFLPEFKKQYADNISDTIASDLKLVIKNIRSFYLAKGSEKSYEFLFRVIFDTFVEFYYPKIDILRASDGKWIEPIYIAITPNTPNDILPYIDKKIVGLTSNSTAYVDKSILVEYPAASGLYVTGFSLLSVEGEFEDGEVIQIIGDVVTPTLTIRTPDGVVAAPGYWDGEDGFLSWNKYLQDNWYYQEFSYVLSSDISIDYYKKIIEENVHPAGLKFFGLVTFKTYEAVQLPDIETFVYWIIHWLYHEVIPVSEANESWFYESASEPISVRWHDYQEYELNREDSPWINLFPTIEYWEKFEAGFFDLHQGKHSTIVSYNGLKLNYNDYYFDNEILNILIPTSGGDIIGVDYLNSPTRYPEEYIADGIGASFTLTYGPSNRNAILVYKNGLKQILSIDYVVVGNTITFVSTPSVSDIIEVIYLDDNNYDYIDAGEASLLNDHVIQEFTTNVVAEDLIEAIMFEDYGAGDNKELFVGDGIKREFTLINNMYNANRDGNDIIVSINGYIQSRTKHFIIENNKLVLNAIVPTPGIGIPIEVIYVKDSGKANKVFTVYDTETQFGCDQVAERFPYGWDSPIEIIV